MPKRKFPSQKEAHERAVQRDGLPSISPVKQEIKFQLKVVDEDIYFGSPRKNTHAYNLKQKN